MPEELKEELAEQKIIAEESKKDFTIVKKDGLINSWKNSRELVSNLLLTVDLMFDLVEKLRKLIYWED